jgi:glucans biosynthesis protein
VFEHSSRRISGALSALALTTAAFVGMGVAQSAQAFSFFDVMKQARELADKSYKAPEPNLPDTLQELKYAGYQQVRFKSDRLHWREAGTKFQLNFYHEGMHFNSPVKINEIDGAGVHEIKFDPDDFDYGNLKLDPNALKNLGFAGFRVLYPVNSNDKKDDELASFLGASYFRVIGKGQTYGLSARGLAIDTALPSGEEFPRFREYWIARPAPEDTSLTIYALLDSPRATGAYRFVIHPNSDNTTVDVKARIYLRDQVGRLGVAPLTSMYLYGSNQPWPTPNYRPEMHDSDGLAIHTGGDEWLWRPLNNPRRLAVSAFSVENPKGFGLLQRGREFSRYEDLDDRYEKRPSLWIEPQGDWGKGSVQLVEIPTKDETNDNIVAFWVPDQQPAKDEPLDADYRMTWTLQDDKTHTSPLAWVTQTRRSREEVKGADLIRRADGSIAYIIDFVGPSLKSLPTDTTVTADTWVDGNGQIVENSVRPNPVTGGRRLTLRVNVKDPTKPVEMRAFLTNGQAPLSETWTYRLPNEPEAK